MWERIYRMLVKEFIQVLRDPRMKALIFVMPVVQLIMFGYAVTTDVDHIKTAVCDLDKSPQSRALIERFTASGYFTVVDNTDRPERLGELLDRGKAIVGIQINRGFADDLRSGRQAAIQTIVDGTDSNTGTVAMDYAQRITQEFSRARSTPIELAQLAQSPQTNPIELRSRAWFNPDLKSRYYNVPGVIAVVVLLISLLLTAMAIVREREIGTMEQLMVTPIRPFELILGKTLPFVLISFIDVLVVTFIGINWFNVPIHGSLGLLLFGAGLYLMSTIGIGLFISTISQTQQQALMSSFFFYLPAVLLSGFMFPISNMPEPAQWLTYLNPLRYFLVIIRDIFLKGSGWEILWPQFAALAVLGSTLLIISSLRFQKRMT
ncbi:ABC transporter membrane protein [Sulfuricella denitrificans skB26]|uniref:ABC transporter membrane protein n=1 Tax=Sulfuricella denitrificans (strain DSM 22764 / NBRC 105220 / skB26) TaxID=1163617 RepID=S6B3R1_SULDS|nr:ABC transporter permease [Sulfuricella denitrificans]BAN35267.1 ABC transporter membrane protein [Sulfuricella denitrificans skB26]